MTFTSSDKSFLYILSIVYSLSIKYYKYLFLYECFYKKLLILLLKSNELGERTYKKTGEAYDSLTCSDLILYFSRFGYDNFAATVL